MNPFQRLILPKESHFNVAATCCVHRGVDPGSYESFQILGHCPSPRMIVKFKQGDALIQRSRNIVASRFLDNKMLDVLLFIDDDIIFDPESAIKVARLVYDKGLDVVAGAYVKKQANDNHFNIKTLDDQPLTFGKNGACEEVMMASTGFMAIHRRVLEAIAKTKPLCHPNDMRFYNFFPTGEKQLEDGSWIFLSEDWGFCNEARNNGFKIWVDCSSKLTHAGRYLYTWDDIFRPNKEKIDDFEYGDIEGIPYHKQLSKTA